MSGSILHSQNLDSLPSRDEIKAAAKSKLREKWEKSGVDLKNPIQVSGSFGGSMGTYTAFGIDPRRDPFFWNFNANINFKILGVIDLPFSAAFSQQQFAFNRPNPDLPGIPKLPNLNQLSFNRLGISPKYKWVTLHLGSRNMTFSPFTLAGHSFDGAGVELTPKNWEIAAMYGRLRRPVPDDSLVRALGGVPAYKRVGYGLKVGYQSKGDRIALSLFRGEDDPFSIPLMSPENATIMPEENLVLGISATKKLLKSLALGVEFGSSALSRDIRSAEGSQRVGIFEIAGPLYTPRTSTQIKNAIESVLKWTPKKFKLDLKYRRIDPDYRSHGTYFFANDLEELTTGIAFQLLENKLSISTRGGLQRNNIEGNKETRNSKVVGAATIAFNPNPNWNLGLNLSNNSSFLQVQRDILSDSLNLYQVAQNAGLNLNRNLGNPESNPQSIGMVLSFNRAFSRTEYSIAPEQVTDFYLANLNYTYMVKATKFRVNTAVNYGLNTTPDASSANIGPSLSLSRSFLERQNLKVTFRSSWAAVLLDGQMNSSIWNNRLQGAISIPQGILKGKRFERELKHSFTASVQFTNKAAFADGASQFSELRTMFGYNAAF